MHALHRQAVAFGRLVELGHDFDAVAADRIAHGFGQAAGGFGGGLGRLQVDFHAFGHGRQRGRVEHARQARDHAVGGDVLARQFIQLFAADDLAARDDLGVLQGQRQHELRFFLVVLQIALFAADLDLVQRRLGDVDVATLHQLGHLAVQQRQQQGADVRAVDVRVGHDDEAVVAQLVDVEVRADAGAQRGDQGGDLLAGDEAVEAGLFHVQHLAAQRQDGLELAIAALLGRAACGVALDDVQLAQRGILFLAVGQLAGQAGAFQHALPAGHFARLARGFAGAGGLDDLGAQRLGVVGVLQQPGFQRAGHGFFDGRTHFAGHQLVLGLAAELGLGHLHRQHAGQAFAHVVAGGLDLGLLGQFVVGDVLVDDAGHRRAQPGQVRAAVALRDVVGEAQHAFAVAVVPLHRHFHADRHAARRGLGGNREHVGVQHGLAAVDVFDEALHAAREREVLFLALALVDQADLHAIVQERQLAQALGEDLVVILDVGEDDGVGQEAHFGAALVGRARHRQRRDALALAEFHLVHLAVAADGQAQPFGQRVDAGHAHAVQAARDLVRVLVELAAGVQLGHDDFRRAAVEFVVLVDGRRDAAAVVGHGDGVVGVDRDDDVVAIAGQGFVDGVVDDFEHHVVQAGAVGRVADVHAGALAHGLQPFEHLDRVSAVAAVLGSGVLLI